MNRASLRIVVGAAGLALAWALLLLEVDPAPTWFYVFAWYPTLLMLDGLASRLDRKRSLFARPVLALSLFAWSPIIWLVFEAVNFRIQNWYYVLLPAHGLERWAGILISFATVVPAILLAERLLRALGVFRSGQGPTVTVLSGHLSAATALGAAMGALALAWPRVFFPLVWGAVLLMVDPLVYRRAPELSLIRDLEQGRWGRIGRLMLGGLGVGLVWETYNYWAHGSWVYTVPGLEEFKLFEMPPVGFVGFPVFALEAWAMYAALASLRLAVPAEGEKRPLPRRTLGAGLVAAGFAAVVLLGMERYTISSVAPRPGDLISHSPAEATAVARLALLRGMGADHARALIALGIQDTCELARSNPERLAGQLRSATGRARPTEPEVRVWVRAAERQCPPP